MKILQDVAIKGSAESLANFDALLEAPTDSGWSRDVHAEGKIQREIGSDGEGYCFVAPARLDRPAARLWIAMRHECPDELYVCNIVPCDEGLHLSTEQQNAISREFFRLIAAPAGERAGVAVTLSKALFEIEDFVSPHTAARLRSFSRLANRSTGSSHPNDQKRWFAFTISAHLESALLDANMLGRWLREVEGWPPEKATELQIEYEQARSLLQQYDHERS